jgi:hypothetical protein
MHVKKFLTGLGVLGIFGLATGAMVTLPGIAQASATAQPRLPKGVTLRQILGGPHYYAKISSQSAWMDKHILVGAWLEQPATATDVNYDVALGSNIYWGLASEPAGVDGCAGRYCRVNYNVIRAARMHVMAPDTTKESGAETVGYIGADRVDITYGPGSDGWNPKGPVSRGACIPKRSSCGFTVANFVYTGKPSKYGPRPYPIGQKPIMQLYSKGVLFWDTDAQAAQFLTYSDTLNADSYWASDPDLGLPSQGACALLPRSSVECGNGHGTGLPTAQRALSANYAFNVTRIEQLESLRKMSKPIVVTVETGCPKTTGGCTDPAEMTSAAWHALIAGARGIIWLQQNFSGQCREDFTFYYGSNRQSPMYNCQQTPGVTLNDVVKAVSAVSHEIDMLNSVLLSPFAQHYVEVGRADVSVMAKYANGNFYIFAAAGQPAKPSKANLKVTFRLAGGYTGPIKVVGEGRTLHAVKGVFTDTFANSNAVHIYET